MLRINFVLEKEVAIYSDDPCVETLTTSSGIFKIDNETYSYVEDAKSLGDAKERVRFLVRFSKFRREFVKTIFGYLGISVPDFLPEYKEVFICNYCSGSAKGEAKISLRKITIYARPPIGAKDMKIKVNRSSYIYNTRNVSAYCNKCGLKEV